jgi:hypothetical protein
MHKAHRKFIHKRDQATPTLLSHNFLVNEIQYDFSADTVIPGVCNLQLQVLLLQQNKKGVMHSEAEKAFDTNAHNVPLRQIVAEIKLEKEYWK